MARILLLVVVGIVVYFLLRGLFRKAVNAEDQAELAKSSRGEDMITCARCGVNLPRSEAIEKDGLLICRDNPACKPKA